MDITLFWFVFVLFGISYFAVAMYASRKVSSEEEYFLAGRKFGTPAITLALIATQLGAGMVLGTADEAFHFGFNGLFYNIGICLGFLLLGFGFAAKLRQFNICTTAELFEIKYKSVVLRKLAAILSVITLGGILAGQIVASKKLINTFTNNYDWLLTCFWLAVIFYTMFGGLKAVVATDIFQVIVIFIIFGGTFSYVLLTQAQPTSLSLNNFKNLQENYFNESTLSASRFTSFLLMPILFSLIEQDLAQRFFSAKNKTVAALSAFLAGIFTILFSFIPLFFGMQTKILNLTFNTKASALLSSVQHLAGPVVVILIVCALIAAISSTADSLLCAIGSNIIYDFKLNLNQNTNYSLTLSRIVTLLTGILALITAQFFDSVLDVITQSYELSVSCLFVPLFFCYFKKRVYKEAAVSSFFCGLFGFIAFHAVPISMPREIATLILSLIGYTAGHCWSKMLSRQKA